MKVKTARRNVQGMPGGELFGEINGYVHRRPMRRGVVCKYWAAGCCRNEHCKFLHGGLPPHSLDYLGVKQIVVPKKWCRDLNAPQKRIASITKIDPSKVKAITTLKPEPTHPAKHRIISLLKKEAAHIGSHKKNMPAVIVHNEMISPNSPDKCVNAKVENMTVTPQSHEDIILKKVERVCVQWALGNCEHGANCAFLHSWSWGDGFTRMTLLQGHKKAISGLSLPSGSGKLYSGSTDGTLRCWDCHTGQCTEVINLGGEIGSLISVGPWLFVGIPNSILAKNIETSDEYVLQGLVGQVHSVIVVNNVIFSGTQDGMIFAWKALSECKLIQPSATWHGHDKAVVSLSVGGNHLYSGSVDHTIKVWDMETLQCLQTLSGHSDSVMSLLCLDQFLISCSLDQTVKIWAVNETGKFEVNYTHKEDHGIIALAGMNDFDSKPILLCVSSDSSVRIYELPSFCERGRLFTKEVVQAIHVGPSGIFFTGDISGCIAVWRLIPKVEVS